MSGGEGGGEDEGGADQVQRVAGPGPRTTPPPAAAAATSDGIIVGGVPPQTRELQLGGDRPRPAPFDGRRTHVMARHGAAAPSSATSPDERTAQRAAAERSALVALMALVGECAKAVGDPFIAPAALPQRIAEIRAAVSVERWIANATIDQLAGFNADVAAGDGAAGRPSPVRAGHVPTWLLRRVGRPHFTAQALDGETFAALVRERLGDVAWLEAWGSSTVDGEEVFICEPFTVSGGTAADLEEFCRMTGISWCATASTWRDPGRRIRIAMREVSQ